MERRFPVRNRGGRKEIMARNNPPIPGIEKYNISWYTYIDKKAGLLMESGLKRRLPTLPHDKCSTIGVSELNFSVRNGKRWNLTTITT